MKNLSLVLNVVLLVAVSFLFYLHFSGTKVDSTGGNSGDTTSANLKVAYIKSDTVLKYYEYLKVNRAQLEAKTQKMEQDYRNRATALQNEITAYQRNVNTMTLGQVRATEENLAKKQQNLQLYQQSLGQQLMDEDAKLTRALYDRVTKYLREYGQERGLEIVLKFDPTSDVLFAGESLDISQEVIKGLNEAYELEKTGGKPGSDTTATK